MADAKMTVSRVTYARMTVARMTDAYARMTDALVLLSVWTDDSILLAS